MSLQITRTGLCDTVQDNGRHGFRHLGIGPAGPMDAFSAGLANTLLGKAAHAPLIEMHFPAASIRFCAPTIICICGADFAPHVDGHALMCGHPYYVPANAVLEFRSNREGRWCYLAVLHEMDLEPWLGSLSTHTKAGGGGIDGRSLRKGDCIPFRNGPGFRIGSPDLVTQLPWSVPFSHRKESHMVSVVIGNEWSWLAPEERERLLAGIYSVSAQSDRMAYRLLGPGITVERQEAVVSSPVSMGTVQLLPGGGMIVLMADHQTTGGYARIAHVTHSGLGILAQKGAHAPFTFRLTDVGAAIQERLEEDAYLRGLKISCTFKIQMFLDAPL